jgi:hypothetical protein
MTDLVGSRITPRPMGLITTASAFVEFGTLLISVQSVELISIHPCGALIVPPEVFFAHR